jgi:hypothetical protein
MSILHSAADAARRLNLNFMQTLELTNANPVGKRGP